MKKNPFQQQQVYKSYQDWINFAPAFKVKPFWRILPKPKSRIGKYDIIIPPSLVFGSGGNMLTQVALNHIPDLCSKLSSKKANILDLGCGSGILAISCAKLGFENVYGMDISDQAIIESKKNMGLNKVKVRFSKKIPNVKYELIVANLYGHLFLSYFETFKKIIKKDGMLWSLGFDRKQLPGVISLYEGNGFRMVENDIKTNDEHFAYIVWKRV
jgi:ribosomal protein L11 methyltransferase